MLSGSDMKKSKLRNTVHIFNQLKLISLLQEHLNW